MEIDLERPAYTAAYVESVDVLKTLLGGSIASS